MKKKKKQVTTYKYIYYYILYHDKKFNHDCEQYLVKRKYTLRILRIKQKLFLPTITSFGLMYHE